MYFYLHTDGSIISKPDVVVDPVGPAVYFDSPFVEKWWYEPPMCDECGVNPKDGPQLCVGCDAYRDHTGAI